VTFAAAFRDVVKDAFAEIGQRGDGGDALESKDELTAPSTTTAAAAAAAAPSISTGDDGRLYDLVGIVLHSGGGYSGHYISLVRDQLHEGDWNARSLASAHAGSTPAVKGAEKGMKFPKLSREQLLDLEPRDLLRCGAADVGQQ
jgi:hypothetical protein